MFVVTCTKNQLTVLQSELLTSGSVNANTVRFNFSRDWSGLVKTVIFQTAEHSIDVILDDGTLSTMVPWEVLTTEGQTVSIGVYGVRIREDGENELVLPTVWGVLGDVFKGASPSKPSEVDPTKDAYADLLERVESMEESTKYVLPIATSETLGGIKLGSGFQPGEDGAVNVKQSWDDISGKPGNLATTQDVTQQINAAIVGVYVYKGSVPNYESLPTENLKSGDVYNVEDTGMNYAYTPQSTWDSLGQVFVVEVMSDSEIDEILNG